MAPWIHIERFQQSGEPYFVNIRIERVKAGEVVVSCGHCHSALAILSIKAAKWLYDRCQVECPDIAYDDENEDYNMFETRKIYNRPAEIRDAGRAAKAHECPKE